MYKLRRGRELLEVITDGGAGYLVLVLSVSMLNFRIVSQC